MKRRPAPAVAQPRRPYARADMRRRVRPRKAPDVTISYGDFGVSTAAPSDDGTAVLMTPRAACQPRRIAHYETLPAKLGPHGGGRRGPSVPFRRGGDAPGGERRSEKCCRGQPRG